MDDFSAERTSMVKKQIAARGLLDPRLLQVFETIPRHLFVPSQNRPLAYDDRALPIGYGQTISQPYIVALMTALLSLEGGERILEVGTGSGYQAAILSRLAGQVYTVELDPSLARRAQDLLNELGCSNIHFCTGDGSLGWVEHAPFVGILVTAFAPRAPEPLLRQLEDGGRMVIPVGSKWAQMLEMWTRRGDQFDCESITPVAFVPLRGQFGWQSEN